MDKDSISRAKVSHNCLSTMNQGLGVSKFPVSDGPAPKLEVCRKFLPTNFPRRNCPPPSLYIPVLHLLTDQLCFIWHLCPMSDGSDVPHCFIHSNSMENRCMYSNWCIRGASGVSPCTSADAHHVVISEAFSSRAGHWLSVGSHPTHGEGMWGVRPQNLQIFSSYNDLILFDFGMVCYLAIP